MHPKTASLQGRLPSRRRLRGQPSTDLLTAQSPTDSSAPTEANNPVLRAWDSHGDEVLCDVFVLSIPSACRSIPPSLGSMHPGAAQFLHRWALYMQVRQLRVSSRLGFNHVAELVEPGQAGGPNMIPAEVDTCG